MSVSNNHSSAYSKGRHYEQLAASYLVEHGYRLVAHNWHCHGGELDLVAVEDGTLVFIEVRSRSIHAGYLPEESILPNKIKRIVIAASAYLQSHPWDGPCRFDVVSVQIQKSGTSIKLIRDAFQA